MGEDRLIVQELEKIFCSRELRLVVNFINDRNTIEDLLKEISEHEEYAPLYRSIGPKLFSLTDNHIAQLLTLSRDIVEKGYNLCDIIPVEGDCLQDLPSDSQSEEKQ